MGSEPKIEQMWHQPHRTNTPVLQIFHLLNLLQKELIWRKLLCTFPPETARQVSLESFPQNNGSLLSQNDQNIRCLTCKKVPALLAPSYRVCQILYSFKLATRSCNSSVCLFKKKKKQSFPLCLFKLHLIQAPICPSLIAFQILKKNDNSFCQL